MMDVKTCGGGTGETVVVGSMIRSGDGKAHKFNGNITGNILQIKRIKNV